MKHSIELPWSIGDTGWTVWIHTVKNNKTCSSCNHTDSDDEYKEEVKECKINAISVTIDNKGLKFWYSVGLDIGDKSYKDRFTYGIQVPNVWATKEEAEAAIDKCFC